MPEGNHKQVPIQVWVDVDEGIAHMVLYLNTISGVRTIASCQGTLGEGGPEPYRAQVMATWPPGIFERLSSEFDVTLLGDNWGYLHPRNVKADVTLAARRSQPKCGLTECTRNAELNRYEKLSVMDNNRLALNRH